MATAGRGLDADYLLADLVAAEPWHFWFRTRLRLVLWTIRTHFPQAQRVLDVGCGSGYVLAGLRGAYPHLELAGCDALGEALSIARRRGGVLALFQADALKLPVRRQFDVLLALDVLEHLDDDRGALAEIFRVTVPGGGVLLTVPQHQWLWSEVDDYSRHRRRYNRTDLVERVRAAGFEVQRCTSLFAATLPLQAVHRYRRSTSFDPGAELRISKTMNAFVGAMLAPEWLAIRAGISVPAGGSLVVVARRPLA